MSRAREILEKLVWENWKCDHPEYHGKVVCIDIALSDLSSMVEGLNRIIPPREHCPCGEDNCDMPMGDYDNGWNDAISEVLKLLKGDV